MGVVENGLIKIFIFGKKFFVDWKRVVKLVKRVFEISCLVLDSLLKKSCVDFILFERDFKKYMNFILVNCFYIIRG